ncbi:MAG TPA: lamin tail domain-containing protein [Nitrososphaera sp.]|nr:lamin tail domain-containing protein [Nitrososphaera sp.]
MPTSFAPLAVLLLAIGIPAAGVNVPHADNITASDIINLVGNATDNNATDSNATGNNDTSSLPPVTGDNATDSSGSVINDIVINEVELNPRGSDAGQEWIELYNPTDVDINMSDFRITTSFESSTMDLPKDAVIKAGETYVVELDKQTLSNTAEILVLENSTGNVVDRTPSLVDRSDDNRTWQRMPDGNNEWKFAVDTKGELNDPTAAKSSATRSAFTNSTAHCLGSAGCAEGVALRIADGDTLYVGVNGTVYKIDLALTTVPSRADDGSAQSTSFTRSLCLGSDVLVDQDDGLLTSGGSVIAVVYCSSTNLNSALLDNGYATLNKDQCKTSEFASQPWAKDHGC